MDRLIWMTNGLDILAHLYRKGYSAKIYKAIHERGELKHYITAGINDPNYEMMTTAKNKQLYQHFDLPFTITIINSLIYHDFDKAMKMLTDDQNATRKMFEENNFCQWFCWSRFFTDRKGKPNLSLQWHFNFACIRYLIMILNMYDYEQREVNDMLLNISSVPPNIVALLKAAKVDKYNFDYDLFVKNQSCKVLINLFKEN